MYSSYWKKSDKIEQHYNTKTLEGRVKSGNTAFNKAAKAMNEAADRFKCASKAGQK